MESKEKIERADKEEVAGPQPKNKRKWEATASQNEVQVPTYALNPLAWGALP